MFKVINALAPGIVKHIFVESNEKHYNLRNQRDFRRTLISLSIIYDYLSWSETISYLGPDNWNTTLEKLKKKQFY